MIELLLETTFWAAVAAAAVALFRRSLAWGTIARLTSNPLVVAALGFGSLLTASVAIDLAYAAPRDLMQDIVSAQQLLKGESLYPFPMTGQIREALQKEPAPWSIGRWISPMKSREESSLEASVTSHWVQAHPPPMSLLISLPVRLWGVHGTILLMTGLSLAALVGSMVLLLRGFGARLNIFQWAALGILLLGWFPVTYTLRCGQSGLLLCLLIITGWYLLRTDRPLAGGLAIGLATGLKLYPGLLLIYLLIRRPKAFVSAVLTILIAFFLVGSISGWRTFGEYSETTRFVVDRYKSYPGNFSILGLMDSLFGNCCGRVDLSKLFWMAAAGCVVLVTVLLPRFRAAQRPGFSIEDLQYGMLVALMPLLSPISWQHYWTVCLLPLFIVGYWVNRDGRWQTLLGFAVLVAALSIPEPTYDDMYFAIRSIGALKIAVKAMPVLSLFALWFWMARVAIAPRLAQGR